MLNLRPYQERCIDSLRKGFHAGHQSQILYMPTGAGKTETAIALMQATQLAGNKCAMVLDRRVLCNQTSQRLDKYNIDHGVLMSGHYRFRPYEPIQICSAQTLEARGSFPGLKLLIVDEAHAIRKETAEFIKSTGIRSIGLTASPFTKGLGNIYTNVVNGITTHELVSEGSLVPLKIFIAKEIDMTGAKKVAGEWSQKEATERGIKITGDVVSEWIAKTHEIFGGPRKTIVFCSGVAHGADLSTRFAESGYNFVSLSYRDDDQFKQDVIDEFSKPDSSIHGLIATDILTKGFDCADVMIGISARPFTKSLSSHIQQMGRVMRPCYGKDFALWLCIAKGSRVLTDQGLIHIDKVTKSHKIWDGTNFVNHGGAVCNGIQEVITYQGLTATAGHLVHTAEGWRPFGECAGKQIRITQTGLGGQTIRIGDDLRPTSFLAGRTAAKIYSRIMRVRDVWIQKFNFAFKFAKRIYKGVQEVQSAGRVIPYVALQQGSSDACTMPISIVQSVSSVWRSWGGVQVLRCKAWNYMDYRKSRLTEVLVSDGKIKNSARQNRPKWTLRAREFALAIGGTESAKQEGESKRGKNAQIQDGLPGYFILRQHIEAFFLGWHDSRSNSGEIQQTFNKTKREVWDILDAGPNNRFTCEGLLVHNCHSGNYLRFKDDWEEIYGSGVESLDDGREKPKKEPTKKEKEQAKCPKCSHVWPAKSDICSHCGHVRLRKNEVLEKPGNLIELGYSLQNDADMKRSFYQQLCFIEIDRGYKKNWARNAFKDKFGSFPMFESLPVQPTETTLRWVKSRLIRFAKRRHD